MSFIDNAISIKADPRHEGDFFVAAKGLQNRMLQVRFGQALEQEGACSLTLVSIVDNAQKGRCAAQTVLNGDLAYVALTIQGVDGRDRRTFWKCLCAKPRHLLPSQATLKILARKPEIA